MRQLYLSRCIAVFLFSCDVRHLVICQPAWRRAARKAAEKKLVRLRAGLRPPLVVGFAGIANEMC